MISFSISQYIYLQNQKHFGNFNISSTRYIDKINVTIDFVRVPTCDYFLCYFLLGL